MRQKSKDIPISKRRQQIKKQKAQQRFLIIGIIVLAVLILYICVGTYFSKHFFPKTEINGVTCDYKTLEEATQLFKDSVADYTLTLLERDEHQETISASEIGLEISLGNNLEELLRHQNRMMWPMAFLKLDEESMDTAIEYDHELLQQVVSTLQCMDESQMYDSQDVHVSDFVPGTGFQIIDAVYGNRIIPDVFYLKLDEAILQMEEQLDLAGAGCYMDPEKTEPDAETMAFVEAANQYANVSVTYEFGSQTEVVDGSVICDWLTTDADQNIILDQSKPEEYIAELAKKYDTKWKSRKLKSHNGSTVTVPSGGNYGWRINQEATLAKLMDCLEQGESYRGEVEYYQTATQYDAPDYGSTYIEVSIDKQHFWYYKDGVVVLESDFVSGDVAKEHDTPKGAYRIAYKARDQVLQGQGYTSPVSYWMPFVDGCGFHDANWRSSFGGEIYKENGSHGCLNLPPEVAKKLYESLDAGTAVLIY